MTEAPATDPETAAGPDSADTTDSPDGRRTWLMVGSLVVALAVLVGLTWVAGGFEQRTDLRTIVAPGTVIATGPYAFAFTAATVQKKKTFDDQVVWEVVVAGTGRTTGDAAITPSTLDWFFSLREPASTSVVEPESQRFGADDRSGGSFFTPGLAPIPYRLVFQLPAALERPTAVQLAVWELEFRDRSLLKTGELSWGRADAYYRIDSLPVQQLADDLD
ncbi:hypothetical protein GCM10022204_20710 [Microlunatus aurantiacus]|uniref:DUF4352 domain-containing protein n=1 Tax=Microlunatus aurantiacus TaxID=446786 RepID=A0ABP7DES0_9ACTN